MARRCRVEGCSCEQFEEPRNTTDSRGRNWLKPLAIGGVCAVGGLILAPFAVPAALGVIGFSSGGVVGGSIAAGMMSAAGNVAAGSSIAIMQSIGAAGLGATGTAVGAAVSGATGLAVSTAAGAGKDDDEHERECRRCNCNKTCTNCHHCECRHLR